MKTTQLALILGVAGVAAYIMLRPRAAAAGIAMPTIPFIQKPPAQLTPSATAMVPVQTQPGVSYRDERFAAHLPIAQIMDWGRQLFFTEKDPDKEGVSKVIGTDPSAAAPLPPPQSYW